MIRKTRIWLLYINQMFMGQRQSLYLDAARYDILLASRFYSGGGWHEVDVFLEEANGS